MSRFVEDETYGNLTSERDGPEELAAPWSHDGARRGHGCLIDEKTSPCSFGAGRGVACNFACKWPCFLQKADPTMLKDQWCPHV